jgi:hypothetical protein
MPGCPCRDSASFAASSLDAVITPGHDPEFYARVEWRYQ